MNQKHSDKKYRKLAKVKLMIDMLINYEACVKTIK